MLAGIWRRVAVAVALAAGAMAGGAQQPKRNPALPLEHVENGPNSAAAQQAHTVVLVSLDAFRWDYAVRDHATHLLAMGKEGVWAPEGMIPSYPSVTYPNHYSIVTGLYPEHHGIVANHFYDPERGATFAASDAKTVTDGSWYGGVPLWSLAEAQGMRTACMFWPGSQAEIAGHRPTWYAKFNGDKESDALDEARIDDTVALLKLPAAERPHFIAIHYLEPDIAGHKWGPDAAETRAAIRKMDAMVGKLKAALDKTGLPIDLVVVSDHGMAKVEGGWITLDAYANLDGFETADALLYGKTEADRQRVYNQLKHVSSQFMVYRRKDVAPGLHFSENPRAGDPVIVATGPYAIRARGPAAGKPDAPPLAGLHGYDPRVVPEMKAIFFAEGPDIVQGKTVLPFENVNLYPWMVHMLGLVAAKNDGNLNILAGTLRDNGGPVVEKSKEAGQKSE